LGRQRQHTLGDHRVVIDRENTDSHSVIVPDQAILDESSFCWTPLVSFLTA
jgi:hypothetical protein